jgi:hypothetical protein
LLLIPALLLVLPLSAQKGAKQGQWNDGTNPLLHAYDKKTGEDIAQIPVPGMQTGVPMTYVHQGP